MDSSPSTESKTMFTSVDSAPASSNIATAEADFVAFQPIQSIDEGTIAPSDAIPLNRGPMPEAGTDDDDDDTGISKSNDPRAKRLGHLREFVGWGVIEPETTEATLRRQAMKARRLSRIMGEGWSVQFSPGTFSCNDEDDKATQAATKAATKGHLFFVWPNWFMDKETWGDDRAELGPMEDQIAEQLDAYAKRFSDAAKKLRDASAEAEFIKSQMQARKATPCNPSHEAQELANNLAALEQQGLIAIGDDNAITALADIPTAEEIEQRAQASQPTILDDDEKQFFDQCMIRGMDDLLRGNAKKRHLLLMATDGDTMSGNETADAWAYVRDCILRVRGAALMLTHERRAILSGSNGTGSRGDVRDISSRGINWLLDFYKENA
jgi:hypothetical protein